MFGWFAPRCPLATREKAWTEWRMGWLAERLGPDRLLRAEVVLPTSEFFEGHTPTPEGAQLLMDRLCPTLGLSPGALRLRVVAVERSPGAVGLYLRRQRQRSVILVAASQLARPVALAATIAHELAHEVLLGGGL